MEIQPIIQHWLVPVARSAGLDGADALNVPSDTGAPEAWDLVGMGTGVDADELASVVAARYRLSLADLDQADPNACRLLPGRVARRLGVVPIRHADRELVVATADPVGFEAEREIGTVSGRQVRFEIATPAAITAALESVYADEPPAHELPPLEPDADIGERILVVDDDPAMRALLRRVLEDTGFRVEEAEDGAVALEILEDPVDPFSMVTLDLDMPELPGIDVLRRIRSRGATATLPVIVATGTDDPDTERTLFEAGADDYVLKPVDPPRFVLRVQAVLRRYRQAG